MRQGALGGSLLPCFGVVFLLSVWCQSAPQAGTLRWARFLSDKKSGKESPKEGPSPSLWNPPRGTGCPCVHLLSALVPVGSHGWCKTSVGGAYFSGSWYFYCQGLTLVCSCSQLPVVWLTAAGTPLLQGRPGGGNCPAIGPAAQGGLVWWHKQEPQPDKTGRKAT